MSKRAVYKCPVILPEIAKVENIEGSVNDVASQLADAYASGEKTTQERLRCTLANVYGLALFLMESPDEWKNFCDDEFWAKKPLKLEDRERAIYFTLLRVLGRNPREKEKRSKYGKLLRAMHRDGVPENEGVKEITKRGIEKTSRAKSGKLKMEGAPADLTVGDEVDEQTEEQASPDARSQERARPTTPKADRAAAKRDTSSSTDLGEDWIPFDVDVCNDSHWKLLTRLTKLSSEVVALQGVLSGSKAEGFKLELNKIIHSAPRHKRDKFKTGK